MKKLILVSLLLSACGAEDKPASTALPLSAVQASPAPAASDSKSIYVTDNTKLPTCDASIESQIAYVASTKEFYACLNDQWNLVDVRGAKGDLGATGADGTTGAKGDTGAQGVQGIAGAQGEMGTQGNQGAQGLGAIPGVGLYWTDPDTLTQWIIVSAKTQFNGVVCPVGFTLPGQFEQLPTKFNEYFSAFEATLPNGVQYWTNIAGRWVIGLDSHQSTLDANGNSQHLFICRN